MAHTLSLMADGGLEPKRLITHRMHYSEMVQAYEMAYHREKSMLGVIFQWKD
jgi:threonine dehydrogenase-like Zn-dependent dehydrogenase